MPDTLTIGALAKHAGVHLETIRYYQRRGLVGEPERPLGGIRHYSEAHVRRLRFIRHAQELGFSSTRSANCSSWRTVPTAARPEPWANVGLPMSARSWPTCSIWSLCWLALSTAVRRLKKTRSVR